MCVCVCVWLCLVILCFFFWRQKQQEQRRDKKKAHKRYSCAHTTLIRGGFIFLFCYFCCLHFICCSYFTVYIERPDWLLLLCTVCRFIFAVIFFSFFFYGFNFAYKYIFQMKVLRSFVVVVACYLFVFIYICFLGACMPMGDAYILRCMLENISGIHLHHDKICNFIHEKCSYCFCKRRSKNLCITLVN